jgi:hypothetical protein
VRYLLTGRLPAVQSILLVESGTRSLVEGLVRGLRQSWGGEIFIDLVTCFATPPAPTASPTTGGARPASTGN